MSITMRIPSGNKDRNLSRECSMGPIPPSSYDTHMPIAPSGDSDTPSIERKSPLESLQIGPVR